jgi:hypothetical protein
MRIRTLPDLLLCVTCGISFAPSNYTQVVRCECASCGAERRIRERETSAEQRGEGGR